MTKCKSANGKHYTDIVKLHPVLDLETLHVCSTFLAKEQVTWLASSTTTKAYGCRAFCELPAPAHVVKTTLARCRAALTAFLSKKPA